MQRSALEDFNSVGRPCPDDYNQQDQSSFKGSDPLTKSTHRESILMTTQPDYVPKSSYGFPSLCAANAVPLVTEEDMRREFDFLDIDECGFIDFQDFKVLFRGLVPKSTFDTLSEQKSKNGKVAFDQYKKVRVQTQFGSINIPKRM